MEDQTSKNEEKQDLNKIDLTALEDFSFGTEWSKIEGGKKRGAPDRKQGGPRRIAGSQGGGDRRKTDRRTQRPSGPPRREFAERRNEGSSNDRGQQRVQQRHSNNERRPRQDNRPYVSPVFDVAFYPEDSGFAAIVKAMRASCHTFELFDIVRLILEKPERSIVVFKLKPEGEESAKQLYVSIPDGMPFATNEEALNHVMTNHVESFFEVEDVEVEAPQGNFQFVNRCPFTKALLAPSNFHRYSQIIQKHYDMHLSERMSFDKFKEAIEVVSDPELVAQWLEQMKKTTRYTAKKVAEGEEAKKFDTLEDARTYLSILEGEAVVRRADSTRISPIKIEEFKDTEAYKAMSGRLEAQRRFPLDTANSLRGRLRRENFHVFKRGSKGITFVCSVKRKFRVVGEVFAESIDRLISFIETNPFVEVAALPKKHLGFSIPAKTKDEMEADVESELSPEHAEALKKMVMDLRWLITEGYVTEFANGTLFAPPALSHPPQGHKPVKNDHGPANTKAAVDQAASTDEPKKQPPVASEDKADEISVVAEEPSVPEAVADTQAEVSEAPVVAEAVAEEKTEESVVEEVIEAPIEEKIEEPVSEPVAEIAPAEETAEASDEEPSPEVSDKEATPSAEETVSENESSESDKKE
jgi:hypothetical protein